MNDGFHSNEHGLGAIPSPPDDRDYPIDQLYAMTGAPKAIVIPPTYVVPSLPAILDQGSSPQCVAFSSGALKLYEDGPWPLNEGLFFARIGGTANGAYVRDAFKQLLSTGYPPDEATHKVSAYFAVPVVRADVQAAILAFGPLVLGMTWLNSMFRPVKGVLTCDRASGVAGGHAILLVGWTLIGGQLYWILQNSWGAVWGVGGQCYLPDSAFSGLVGEAWKAVDVVDPPIPPSPPYTPRTAMNYTGLRAIRVADSRAGCTPKVPSLAPGANAIKLGGMFGLPTGVLDVVGKVEIIGPSQAGWVNCGPDNAAPTSSTTWFPADANAHPMSFVAPVSADGTLYIWNGTKVALEWDLDITGYFS